MLRNQLTSSTIFLRKYFCTFPVLLQYSQLYIINIFSPELLLQIQSLTLLQYLQLWFSLQFYSIICNSNSVFSFPPVSETQIQSQVLLQNPWSKYSLQFYYKTLTPDTVSSSTPVSATQIQSPVLPQYLQLNLINIFSTKSLLQIKSQGLLKLLNFINNFSTEPFLRIKSPVNLQHQPNLINTLIQLISNINPTSSTLLFS